MMVHMLLCMVQSTHECSIDSWCKCQRKWTIQFGSRTYDGLTMQEIHVTTLDYPKYGWKDELSDISPGDFHWCV
ncbi:hypothetical protein Hdeb2414_s0189g00827761 [Helianthus debilis subsp. tardiflorus]